MERDEFAHVRRLVAALHCRQNVARPPSASETDLSEADDVSRSSAEPAADELPQAPRFKSNSIAAPTLSVPSRLGRNKGLLGVTLPAAAARSGSLSATPHFAVPRFTVTAPAEQRRASHCSFLHVGPFTLRRHSNTSLHRSESMVSLACFRQLAGLVSDDVSGLQAFLQANKSANVDDRDENGTTALMVACEAARCEAARLLLGAGADPGAADLDGWTPLALCARAGLTHTARELLDAGAPVDPRDMGGWTPLMWASYKGHEETVALLLERGADVHAYGNYHINSLVWAAGRAHSGVVRRLLAAGARANSCDKYATSALTWAARAGDAQSVAALLAAGADVNTHGMYSWTPLLQAAQGNHYEIVQMLLEHKPNVNALDKDGYTALCIACKEGHYDIAVALINANAYINVQDHSKDTCLIHAVKGGHKSIVEALLKKYADVDLPGKERKTAVYTAVEKGHVAILKLLLQSNPDLELATVTGDTPLLRAVRCRNAEMVQLLLDKKARVGATDKRGDTVLHVAMRARSKQIVEILLRNPKHSQLLYKPNKSNETPYNIDMSYPKTILGQIFGARKINTNEDTENMLGYELYSAALADMLSEPSLSVPITVGLYARWGSGKSFLLNKLKEEMKNFARQWSESGWTWSWCVAWAACHAALLAGAAVAAGRVPPLLALAVSASLLLLIYCALYALWYISNRWEWYWPYAAMSELARRLHSLQLVLQVVFCHPPGVNNNQSVVAQPIRFHFTAQPPASAQEAEASVVHMVASLQEALESQYGRVCTRLFRAFRPKPVDNYSQWRFRRACCVPQIVAFELSVACVLLGLVLLVLYLTEDTTQGTPRVKLVEAMLMCVGSLLAVGVLANLYTCGRVLLCLVLSPRAQLARSLRRHHDSLHSALKPEVSLLADMVGCLDAFTEQRTRLVVVVDALDSCEQDRVLSVLNSLHALCSDPKSPFILILAIDPHIISKAVEVNSRRAFSESNIGGWDYLRNMVQLPFYLQNSALRRVKVAQQTALKRYQTNEDYPLQRSVSARRLSATSELMSSQERIKPAKEAGGASARARRLRPSESVASSVASGLHRVGSGVPGGAADLGRVLLTDDYFSDVNPRSMRRLMNVLYITGRLLKSFQIDFNWYQLASWVNLTEQWPFRTSWIIYHYETYEEHIDDNTSLKHIYDKIKACVPLSEPLQELDRDERKLEVFLGLHRHTLLVADLKIFLPFSINLDPYIKKVIKEEQQQQFGLEEEGVQYLTHANKAHKHTHKPPTSLPPAQPPVAAPPLWVNWGVSAGFPPHAAPQPLAPALPVGGNPGAVSVQGAVATIKKYFPNLAGEEVRGVRLSGLSVEEVAGLCARGAGEDAARALRQHKVCGAVLANCDLTELKQVLNLPFGEWEMLKILVRALREIEVAQPVLPLVHVITEPTPEGDREPAKPQQRPTLETQRSRPSNVEKQVTLEEQMICGALQTLSEEALEDESQEPPESECEASPPGSPRRAAPPRKHKHDANVTFKFEDETADDEQITFSIDKKRGAAHFSRNTRGEPRAAHSSLCEQNSKRDKQQRQGSARARPPRGSPLRPRPASLAVGDEPAAAPARSHSVDDPCELTNKLKSLKSDLLTKVNSSDKLSRLRGLLKSSQSRERSPARADDSDDESTPLVSSDLSSPSPPPPPPRDPLSAEERTPTDPPPQKHPHKAFGVECDESSTDATVSTDCTPSEPHSSADCTPAPGPLEAPPPAAGKEGARGVRADSLGNMHEPYNLALLGGGGGGESHALWRQDAVEDPESSV